jgi:hypothetical protein
MATLRSDLFKGDKKLENCASLPSGHLLVGTPPGQHISKVHEALEKLRPGGPAIAATERSTMSYGKTTAAAVLHYKQTHDPPIINFAYQTTPDAVVGQMTIKAMDEELFGSGPTPLTRDQIADRAFADSRASLRVALDHMRALRGDIRALPQSSDPSFGGAMVKLLAKHKRNLSVLSRRLLLTPDPTSQIFKDSLDKVIALAERNLAHPKTILAAGTTGMCTLSHPRNAGGLPHAWTDASAANPKTHLCEPFFTTDSRDLQRDVVTHEYFHLFGLGDNSVNNTNDAFRNANTIAQIVALLTDRFRQANSDGGEAAVPPHPMP